MSHAVAVLATIIVSTLLLIGMEVETRKDFIKAGYVIVDGKAYRVTPVER